MIRPLITKNWMATSFEGVIKGEMKTLEKYQFNETIISLINHIS